MFNRLKSLFINEDSNIDMLIAYGDCGDFLRLKNG